MAVLPQILSSVILLSRPDILENIFYAWDTVTWCSGPFSIIQCCGVQ